MSSNTFLPPLVDGRRYQHEGDDTKPILPENHPKIWELLRNYHTAIHLHPTLSSASRTNVPTPSISSTGTSQTEATFAWSASNGSLVHERETGHLSNVQRTRKALLRKLVTCSECGERKVKCMLYHHRLRDLLVGYHTPEEEALVEWAIRIDALPENLSPTTPDSGPVERLTAANIYPGRETVVDQADNAFGLTAQETPQPYAPQIEESIDSLLGVRSREPPGMISDNEANSTPIQAPALPQLNNTQTNFARHGMRQYSVMRVPRMFWIGKQFETELQGIMGYVCCYMFSGPNQILFDCGQTFYSISDLVAHYSASHFQFVPLLEDPLRLVCSNPACDTFYRQTIPACRRCSWGHQPVVRVYGQMGLPAITVTHFPDISANGGSEHDCFRYYGTYSEGNHFNVGNTTYYPNSQGRSGTSGSQGSYYGYQWLLLVINKLCTWTWLCYLRLFRGLLRQLSCTWWYTMVVCITLVMALLNYEIRDWLVTMLGRMKTAMSTGEPYLGALVAAVAFSIYRFIAHTRAGLTRNDGRRRCPLRQAHTIRLYVCPTDDFCYRYQLIGDAVAVHSRELSNRPSFHSYESNPDGSFADSILI